MKPIKIFLDSHSHSLNRGVGFYAANLEKYLSQLPEIKLTNQNPDLIHYPFFDLFYPTLPLIKKIPVVVTIHDVTPLVLSNLYPKGIKGSINLLRQRFSLLNIAAVITDSQCSASDLINFLHLPAEKINVIYPACDPIFNKPISDLQIKNIKNKYHLPNKFILNVSAGPNPNKNLPFLAAVTKRLNIPLVIVGAGLLQDLPKQNIHPELQDLAKLKKYSHIIYPGFVPTADLVGFYKLASVYCQPSLYEGFGIPLIEAMSAGCLLVSSNVSSLPELYAQDTITFNPKDINECFKALKLALSLSSADKQKLIASAKKKSLDFNWSKTAQQTLKVYQKIIQ